VGFLGHGGASLCRLTAARQAHKVHGRVAPAIC
jgi:hypothetical protein